MRLKYSKLTYMIGGLVLIVIIAVVVLVIVLPIILTKNQSAQGTNGATVAPTVTVTKSSTINVVTNTIAVTTTTIVTSTKTVTSTAIVTSTKTVTSTAIVTSTTTVTSTITETTTVTATTTGTRTTTATVTTTTTMVSENLLINPGAELLLSTGWTQTGVSPVIRDENGAFLSGYNQYNGDACFLGGYGTAGAPSSLLQNVNLTARPASISATAIDTGTLKAEVSFHYQNWYNIFVAMDAVKVTITFRSATNSVLSTRNTGSLLCTSSNPGWCYHYVLYSIPSGTRSIDYTMIFIRNGGTHIDAYIDDNSLRII